MSSRVGKWGGSLSVRLPKNIVELLAIRAGDAVRVRLGDDGTITIRPLAATHPSPESTQPPAQADAEEPLKW
jgi:antitoxin component of MazEF toxin-antitoxin module